MQRYGLTWSCTDLMLAHTAPPSSCSHWWCHVWSILFHWRYLACYSLITTGPCRAECDKDIPSRGEHSNFLLSADLPIVGFSVNCHLLKKKASRMVVERGTNLWWKNLGDSWLLCLFSRIVVLGSPLGLRPGEACIWGPVNGTIYEFFFMERVLNLTRKWWSLA